MYIKKPLMKNEKIYERIMQKLIPLHVKLKLEIFFRIKMLLHLPDRWSSCIIKKKKKKKKEKKKEEYILVVLIRITSNEIVS